MVKVLLFDIDGTLVLTGGAGARAMARAFDEVFGIRGTLAQIPMNGRTDAWIVSEVTSRHGVDCGDSARRDFRRVYLQYLSDEIVRPGPRKGVMPGVRRLLDVLVRRPDVHVALLTGNFEGGARVKLEYFDLWRYFRCGAFGDDAHERNSLFGTALCQLEASGVPRVPCSDVVVIGDTPLDVAVAVSGRARSLAVATGNHDVESLRASGADVVLESLDNLASVLDACGLDQDAESARRTNEEPHRT